MSFHTWQVGHHLSLCLSTNATDVCLCNSTPQMYARSKIKKMCYTGNILHWPWNKTMNVITIICTVRRLCQFWRKKEMLHSREIISVYEDKIEKSRHDYLHILINTSIYVCIHEMCWPYVSQNIFKFCFSIYSALQQLKLTKALYTLLLLIIIILLLYATTWPQGRER